MSRDGQERVLCEVRADVAAARDRDPAAQGVSSFEILTSWAGVQALLAHRVAHALRERRGAAAAAGDRLPDSRAITGVEIHPAAGIGRRVLHRPRLRRGDRRDGGDRRRG